MKIVRIQKRGKNNNKFILIVIVLSILLIFLILQKNGYAEDNYVDNYDVLVISYFPLNESNNSFDRDLISGLILEDIKANVSESVNGTIKNTKYSNYLNLEFYKEVPYNFNNKNLCVYSSVNFVKEIDCQPDFFDVFWNEGDLVDETGLNICDFVDGKGVKEICMYSYHGHYNLSKSGKLSRLDGHQNYELDVVVSDMSLGMNDRNHWNYNYYGDLSEKGHKLYYQSNDLPICQNSYFLFNLDYYDVNRSLSDLRNSEKSLFKFVYNRD